jgi:hypothetical protein
VVGCIMFLNSFYVLFNVFLYYRAKLRCVFNHVLPQANSNCADRFAVFIRAYADMSAFVALFLNSFYVLFNVFL